MAGMRLGIVAGLAICWVALPARGQAVAFQPMVGALPNGPALGATPVVSADRRYVRLTLVPQFIGNAGFNTYSVPGAVSGGAGGPGALGGIGAGGIGGAGVGGGGTFLAGMNGVIDPTAGYGFGGMPPGPAFGLGYVVDPLVPGNSVPGPPGLVASPALPRTALARTAKPPRVTKRGVKPRPKAPPPSASATPARP
jgi:hypothetical protein